MSFLYQSTRGQTAPMDFQEVTLTGLAPDGGLFIPVEWPRFSKTDIAALQGLPYVEVAFRIIRPFVQSVLNDATLHDLLTRAYAPFRDDAVTPLKPLGDHRWVLELFHGPTLAFKDIALQLLGHLFEHFLAQSGDKMTVLGATSGDTGSAAIAALAGRKNIETFILYPQGRPSDIQRKQMTCVEDSNVHALAIEGSFDDGQSIVKALFNDPAARARYHLAAINSINWARVLAQIVYYFYAAVQVGSPDKPVTFVVPTGNFGNVFAAYAAMKCGLPIQKLVVASNSNDILPRFFATGRMEISQVVSTLSPSMDIQISSNFERFLFDLCGSDACALRDLMGQLKNTGCFTVSEAQHKQALEIFEATAISDEETLETIKATYQKYGMILDPHSAIGVAASEKLVKTDSSPVITLACAHPAKFPQVIEKAINITPEMPAFLADLLRNPERTAILPARVEAVEAFLAAHTTA